MFWDFVELSEYFWMNLTTMFILRRERILDPKGSPETPWPVSQSLCFEGEIHICSRHLHFKNKCITNSLIILRNDLIICKK